jgi:hypothetical protein
MTMDKIENVEFVDNPVIKPGTQFEPATRIEISKVYKVSSANNSLRIAWNLSFLNDFLELFFHWFHILENPLNMIILIKNSISPFILTRKFKKNPMFLLEHLFSSSQLFLNFSPLFSIFLYF